MTNAKSLAPLCTACFLTACGGAPDPAVFDAGLENQAGLTFSPDGNTAYWVAWDGTWGSSSAGPRTIFMSRREGSSWSTPEAMPFSGEYSDDDPFVSPDGQWLYFVSERSHADIWRYRLDGSGLPERLAINSEAAEYSPVIVASGALYFASARPGGPGQGDVYRADPVGDGFAEPVVLGPAINSPTGEWNVWVSPDESRMIFEASGRPTNVSEPGDLYFSCHDDKRWTTATPVESLNTRGSDLLPRLHPDGRSLYYTSAQVGAHAAVFRQGDYATAMPPCPPAGHETVPAVVADDATPVRVATGFAFTEGPAADRAGNVFFTDQPNNRIHKWSVDGAVTVFMDDAGRANGLYVDQSGNLLACADENGQLWRISPDREVTVLFENSAGRRLNGPNDLWVDSSGGVYFTDPWYQREYWSHNEPEIDSQNVYYLSPDGRLSIVDDDFVRPNGIIGDATGEKLYVADIGAGKTYVYTISEDGMPGPRREFAPMGSDGMTIDMRGNVYLTGDGVTVFNARGEEIHHIEIDEPWTANVTFGGADRRTLFITASGSIYTLEMNVQGAH